MRGREAGVSVDAWMGIALALHGVRALLADPNSVSRLRAGLANSPVRAAADRRLRGWQRYLSDYDSPGLRDELPEIVLAESVSEEAARRHVAAVLAISSESWEIGRQCEMRAAGANVPLPTYIRDLAGAL